MAFERNLIIVTTPSNLNEVVEDFGEALMNFGLMTESYSVQGFQLFSCR
jgi:hypothetical protein